MQTIKLFRNEYFFLSNFYPTNIYYNGILYKSSEAAFQAAKTNNLEEKIRISKMSASLSKRAGRHVQLRPDWETEKFKIMEEIVRIKFSSPKLRELLKNTGDAILVEGNTWHDNTWGSCSCWKCVDFEHKNELGNILMKLRSEI